ncbi:hypothetical protein [Aureimonas endophytica]|nr:hypothetical protein [Aureimonas endophytica]
MTQITARTALAEKTVAVEEDRLRRMAEAVRAEMKTDRLVAQLGARAEVDPAADPKASEKEAGIASEPGRSDSLVGRSSGNGAAFVASAYRRNAA